MQVRKLFSSSNESPCVRVFHCLPFVLTWAQCPHRLSASFKRAGSLFIAANKTHVSLARVKATVKDVSKIELSCFDSANGTNDKTFIKLMGIPGNECKVWQDIVIEAKTLVWIFLKVNSWKLAGLWEERHLQALTRVTSLYTQN